jgi:radical SAM protein with 4Fe4S-binding SPASM domain
MTEKRKPCAGLWKTPMIHVNGDVTTCCLDEHLENKVGNINQKPLSEIWRSPKLERWRQEHLDGKYDQSGPLCGRCNWRSAGMLSDEEAEQFRCKNKEASKNSELKNIFENKDKEI